MRACDASCLCFHLSCAAKCNKDEKNIPNILEGSILGLRVSASTKSNCFSCSAVHGKHGALASARVSCGSGSAEDCAIAVLQNVSLNRLSWTSASVFLTLSPYIKSQMWPP